MHEREMIEVLQAHLDGKEIEARDKIHGLNWVTVTHYKLQCQWNFVDWEYRIKQQPRVIYVTESDYLLRSYHHLIETHAREEVLRLKELHKDTCHRIVKFQEIIE